MIPSDLADLCTGATSTGDLPRERVPALLANLEDIRAQLLARLLAPAPEAPAQDKMLTVEEVAERLNVDVRWVYEHADTDLTSCCRRIGARTLRFSSKALDRWLDSR